MEVLWLLHHGLTREKVAKIVGVGLATVKQYANAYRDGGLDAPDVRERITLVRVRYNDHAAN